MTKAAARAAFIYGTLVFLVIFAALTALTHREVPTKTNQVRMTPQVVSGKEVFERSNCVNCHTLLGEGAYFAPDLTRVWNRRGGNWLARFLKEPDLVWYGGAAQAAGQRRMPALRFTDRQVADLVAYLEWIDRIDTNGFLAEPQSGKAMPPVPGPSKPEGVALAEEGAKVVRAKGCTSCHRIRGVGGDTGPALDGVKARRDDQWLARWLRDPRGLNPRATMPRIPMSDDQIRAVVEYLKTL